MANKAIENQGISTRTVEMLHTMPIGIYNETDRLRKAAIWGPIGAEAVLAQIYPPNISLFYDYMNVPAARQEILSFEKILQQKGVEITMIRDELANALPIPEQPLEKKDLIKAIVHKAKDISSEYPGNNPPRRSIHVKPWYEMAIRSLIQQDIDRYGEQKALALNKALCLDTQPLGNAIYARDQMNVLLGTRFQSSMAKPIRKPEVALYEKVYQQVMKLPEPAVLPEGETFEGGDAYVHNGTVYVGVGIRTTKGAAEFMYKTLRPQLEEKGMKFAIVEEKHPDERSAKEQMDFMHLDTFSSPIGDKEIAVCEEEARRRRVSYLQMGEDGSIMTVDTGDSFLDHLQKSEDTVVIIPREEQQEFGCNFLAIDNHTLLLPLASNPKTNERLKAAGKELVFLGLQESTRGYGASHCMTGQLARAN